jgi:predicted RNA-binding protein associated with RNAse of E/G family
VEVGHNKPIKIHKLDAKGNEQWRYEGIVQEEDDTRITLEAYFDHEEVEFEGIQLRRGDRFVETFYFDRWYNIFAIYDGKTDEFKGWYCNITRPARIEMNHLYAEDLALDLIVFPDRTYQVVDQDEFEALNLSRSDRSKALYALDELIERAKAALQPFLLDP